MSYSISINGGKLDISCDNITVINNLTLRVNFAHARYPMIDFVPAKITSDGNCQTVEFLRDPVREWLPEAEYIKLKFTEIGDVLTVFADVKANDFAGPYNYHIAPFGSVYVNFDIPDPSEQMSLHILNPFWDNCHFGSFKDIKFLPIDTVNAKICGKSLNILPVYNGDVSCELLDGGLVVNNRVVLNYVSGTVMSLCVTDDPLSAIHNNVSNLIESKTIKALSRADKVYPDEFEGFGWCTWNAFYKNVTADKIYEKLDEFKQKGIMPRWLLIDDGWSLYDDDRKLLSFKEDTNKFPEGLSECIKKIKSYGVKYVGVWHAFTAMWNGIAPDSEICKEHGDLLYKSSTGFWLPGPDEEKGYKFWDLWHGYLKSQGVDYVKVDNQYAISSQTDYIMPASSGVAAAHSALERSVKKHFGGAIINCMGLTLENNMNRTYSAINRNSDDYFPNRENDFSAHTIQNIYSGTLNREFHFCDYDMFFSYHHDALPSAVVRAISGGPVYVSDELGKTNADVLKHLCTPDGETARFDDTLLPTPDCFYLDCNTECKPLKVYNRAGENLIFAAFGVSIGKTANGTFRLDDIPDSGDKYLAHDYFADKYFVVDRDTEYALKLGQDELLLLSLYPIKADGTVSTGNTEFFAEAATKPVKTAHYEEYLK